MTVIKIPNVARDERIGSAFNELFQVINKTECATPTSQIVWDFDQCCFFHPFFLAPLAIYKDSTAQVIKCINMSDRIQRYFNTVHFHQPLIIDKASDIRQKLDLYQSKTYTPICKFALNDSRVTDEMQTIIQQIIEHQSHADYRIKSPLSYFLGELICNIYQHSDSQYGYIYSQYLHREQCVDICIADSGITIYSSYIKANKYISKITNEVDTLKLANAGFSTKDLPDAENRGYGLSSTKQMLVEGLKGEFFMLSGSAFHRHICTDEEQYVLLPDTIRWDGTIILLRIPINVPQKFDYYKYIK
jgi:hypothetical protein